MALPKDERDLALRAITYADQYEQGLLDNVPFMVEMIRDHLREQVEEADNYKLATAIGMLRNWAERIIEQDQKPPSGE